MGVEQAQGVLLSSQIVAQYQIHLKVLAPAAGNGGDGVMRLPFRLGIDADALIGISPPGGKNLIRQLDDPAAVGAAQADDRHGPADDAGLHILKAGEDQLPLHRGLLHGEAVAAALEMVMT